MDKLVSDTYGRVTERLAVARDQAYLSLLAVGGYGRSELYPHSDIDMLILSHSGCSESKELAQQVLYDLWDRGIDLSHSFRTVRQCVEDAMQDITTRTSLLESRLIAGSKELYETFLSDAHQKIVFKNRKGFVADILRDVEKRHRQFGESVFLLEPNIKEGKGGLRDVHAISWLLKVARNIDGEDRYRALMPPSDFKNFMKAYEFMVRLRVALHGVSGRKNEVLSFDLQEDTARYFRFARTSRSLSAEIMMRIFYSRARSISYFLQHVAGMCSRRFVSLPPFFGYRKIEGDFYLYNNEIVIKDKSLFDDKEKILEAFQVFSTTRNRFSPSVRDLIRRSARRIRRKMPLTPKMRQLFLGILGGRRVFETLREMHDTAVLEKIIPEYSRLRHLVIYEPAHRYTVDKHSLVAVKHLEELYRAEDERNGHLRDILVSADQKLLVLTILLHDIGKGISRDHSEEGYRRIKGILERLGLDPDSVRTIKFLVKNHIMLAKLALSRDIDAPETIIQLADMVSDEQTLNALYLITYADMKALNPGFLTEWKKLLLRDLHLKTRNHLRGSAADVLSPGVPIKDFLRKMPRRYLVGSTREMMEEDYLLAERVSSERLVIGIRQHEQGPAEITIVTRDRPYLFASIVDTLARKNLDILRARVYTGDDGLVVDRILVSNWKDLWWDGLEDEILHRLLVGSLDDGIPSDQDDGGDVRPIPAENPGPPIRVRRLIEIDNEDSDDSTIIEMLLPDWPGLLRHITQVISHHGITILTAVINTDDSVAHDVFYVQKGGRKLDNRLTLSLIASLESVKYEQICPAGAYR